MAKKLSAATNRRRNTVAGRKKMPASAFGLPKQRKYRLDDAAHARNAKARATQGVKRGTLSKSAAAQVKARANKVLRRKGG